MSTLEGKTVLVTGGGSGIGAEIARNLAASGCRVAITGRRESRLQEVVDSSDKEILFKVCDVADRADVSRLFEWAREMLGSVEILVNSAGINVAKRSMAELDPADWDKLLQINATGAYNSIREALPQMREKQDGVIVNISSVAGIRAGLLGGVAYNASKFAMSALSLTVGEEESKNGIRLTSIYPGEVETPILDERPVLVSAEHRARILQPEDLAAAALMVISLPPRARVPELVIIPTRQSFT
ncbi:MAG: SDR family NAD(P)-dependent oxidoreductase [Planctomycetota bacterium]|nr:SDR family NAD(P)-dependent oxidoreductase [Planctomycetota bacterium]MDA0918488.1 SDR family NAD(P)-dependent oxidoreductase [Planctomycetota bacterium]